MDLEIIARTSALLAMAAGLSWLLRTATPATRHLVWHLAIVLAVLTPLLAPLAPPISVPMVRTAPEVRTASVDSSANDEAPARRSLGTSPLGTVGTPGALRTLRTVSTVGTVILGAWYLLCWLLSGWSVTRGSRRAPDEWLSEARAVAARFGISGIVDVRESARDGSPHVAGLLRSVVMMPPSARRWTSDQRQAAFVHELTHIRRHDRRTQAIAQLACAIYWFNPLVWHAAAGLARERERACDDEVLRAGIKPSAYASLLLDLARRPAAWTPAMALSMARPSAIEGRLVMVLADVVRSPRRSTRWLVGVTVGVFATAVLGAQPTPPAVSPAETTRPLIKPQAVMQLDDPRAGVGLTDLLIGMLGDTDGQVREQATLGLALTPGDQVIDPLLAALTDADPQVREKAAIGLAFRRDPRIVDALLIAITDDDRQVREKVAMALGASGDVRAVAALTVAARDPDSQVREKAVAGLVLLGLRR